MSKDSLPQKWLIVEERKEPPEEKKEVVIFRVPRQVARASRFKGGGGRDHLKIQMFEIVSKTSAANTAYSTTYALQPKNLNDWASVTSLFDLARCHGVSVVHRFTATGAPTTQTALGILAFDPGVNVALTSIVDGMSHQYHSGPVALGNVYGTSVPNGATPTGLIPAFKAKIQKPVIESGTSDLVGGGWFPATSSVAAIVGYLTPYFEAVGSSLTVTGTWVITYHMEFRFRH